MGPFDAAAIFAEYNGYAERLKPYVADTTAYLLDAVEVGQAGFVRRRSRGTAWTSITARFRSSPAATVPASACRADRACRGVGSTKCIGVVKAYSTRVGGGPFPTEQDNEIGQHLRERGNEYGTVTRRPRRCGWFDAVAVRYTARLSGVDALAVMLLDVLSKLPETQNLHRLRNRRPPRDAVSQPRRRFASCRCRCTKRCRAGMKKLPRPGKWPICRKMPGDI